MNKLFTVMGGNFKFQVQDSELECVFLEFWRFEKRIALSEKKATFNSSSTTKVTLLEVLEFVLFMLS